MKALFGISVMFFFLTAGFFTTHVYGVDDASPALESDDAQLDDEFEWLREEAVVMTEIATRTKMDADLVPGMVTILLGDDLKARGMQLSQDG